MMLPRLSLPVLLTCAVLAACAAPDASPSVQTTPSSTPSPVATPMASPSPSSSEAASPTPSPVGTNPPQLALELVAGGVADPIGIAPVPNGDLLVNERGGRVLRMDPATGETTVALDITDRVLGEGERGLLGLALHPDWPEDLRVFVHYTDGSGRTVLSSFTISSVDPVEIDPASESVLLTVDQPFANHNGGQLAFGPDGYLYMGLGDGGSGGDPLGNGQNPRTLLGSILRLDVGTPADDGNDAPTYGIPAGNPFADGVDGAPEVFAYGVRNPWRFSFDRATGLLWIGDVGQGAYEEVDRLDTESDAGANLGWNVMEGAHCYDASDCVTDGLMLPLTEYDHGSGCSITGGYVYRGADLPGLAGWYVFSDYCSGILFGVPSDAAAGTAPTVLADTDASVTALGEDADGTLYLADIGSGAVYRIVEGG